MNEPLTVQVVTIPTQEDLEKAWNRMPDITPPELTVVDHEASTTANDDKNSKPTTVRPLAHRKLPKTPDISPDNLRKMDAMGELFGMGPVGTDILKYGKDTQKVAEHYRTEAQRIYASKIFGRDFSYETPDGDAEASVVGMPWHDRLRESVGLGHTIAVRGPAGNGKSTGVRSVLRQQGYNIYHMDCTDSLMPDQLVGGITPEPVGTKGAIQMVFKPGLFARAFADPFGCVVLDEFDALDPRTALCLQSALQRNLRTKRRWLSLPDHEKGGMESMGDCPVVVTMNTWGTGATREYVGRNSLDAASLDRFDSVLDTTYGDEEAIVAAAGIECSRTAQIIAIVREIREQIDKKNLRVVLSTRGVITLTEAASYMGLSIEEAFNRFFYERLEEHDRKALARTFTSAQKEARHG